MPYADELDRYLHVRADRRALRTLRDRYPEEYEQAYRAERATILAAMAAKVGAPVIDPTEAPIELNLAAPVSVAAQDDPQDDRPGEHGEPERQEHLASPGEAVPELVDAAVVEQPRSEDHASEDVVGVADAEADDEVAQHVAERSKKAPKPPIICDVCNVEVPRTGKQGKPRQRHEACQVRSRVQGSVSRETSVVQDRPVPRVITLPTPPPVVRVSTLPAMGAYRGNGDQPLPAPEPVVPAQPVPTYQRDPSGPPDDPSWNPCPGCGYGYNPKTLSCGCQIGVLDDDDAPADKRFAYLGPNDDY